MKTLFQKIATIVFFLITGLGANGALAQSGGNMSQQEVLLIAVLLLVLLVAVIVLIVALYMVSIVKAIMQQEYGDKAAAEMDAEAAQKPSFWKRFSHKMNDAVPVEEEESIMLDHNYDGIKELDNHLPPWWKWLFYITIIISVIYLFVYHVINVLPLQHEEYVNQLERAEEMQAQLASAGEVEQIDINDPQLSTEEEDLTSGRSVYNINCASCHAEDGGGGIGPNLTDNYWLHGGSFKDIFSTVHDGVDGTSMIAWKNVLTPVQVRDVSSFVTTLQGTDPANPKAPEGELYTPEQGDLGNEESIQDTTTTNNTKTADAGETTQGNS